MPWKTQADVRRHNKAAAKSPRKGRVWRKVANKLLAKGASEGSAIRQANAVAGRIGGDRHRVGINHPRKPEGRSERLYGGLK